MRSEAMPLGLSQYTEERSAFQRWQWSGILPDDTLQGSSVAHEGNPQDRTDSPILKSKNYH